MTTQMIISSVCSSRYQDLLEKKNSSILGAGLQCLCTRTHTHTLTKSLLPFVKTCSCGTLILLLMNLHLRNVSK